MSVKTEGREGSNCSVTVLRLPYSIYFFCQFATDWNQFNQDHNWIMCSKLIKLISFRRWASHALMHILLRRLAWSMLIRRWSRTR